MYAISLICDVDELQPELGLVWKSARNTVWISLFCGLLMITCFCFGECCKSSRAVEERKEDAFIPSHRKLTTDDLLYSDTEGLAIMTMVD